MNRCFAMDKSVQECIRDSSVIVTGVPSSTFTVPSQWIQPGSTVINVASEPNVDVDELRDISGVQYVGQVGKVTVALLEHNLVRLHQLFHTK
jgi:methylenetetrahydrofolate dehydrogenase (NAD+)